MIYKIDALLFAVGNVISMFMILIWNESLFPFFSVVAHCSSVFNICFRTCFEVVAVATFALPNISGLCWNDDLPKPKRMLINDKLPNLNTRWIYYTNHSFIFVKST